MKARHPDLFLNKWRNIFHLLLMLFLYNEKIDTHNPVITGFTSTQLYWHKIRIVFINKNK